MTQLPEGSPSADVDRERSRARILDAAYAAFSAQGYTRASTLEIATRAKVSKRELYALVGNKHDLLVACIAERASRLRAPAILPEPRDRESLATLLEIFGEQIVREISDPAVVGVYRLAIAEAGRAPEIPKALDSVGRAAARTHLVAILDRAKALHLVDRDPATMASLFLALLWGDLMMGLLLGLYDTPTRAQARARARDAAANLLRLG